MSQLNVLSTENISTYNKFKLQDGNLYMNNKRVGIEVFGAGKNMVLSDHLYQLADHLDLSGALVVDGSMVLGNDLSIDGNIQMNGSLTLGYDSIQVGDTFIYGNGPANITNNTSTIAGNLDVVGVLAVGTLRSDTLEFGGGVDFSFVGIGEINTLQDTTTILVNAELLNVFGNINANDGEFDNINVSNLNTSFRATVLNSLQSNAETLLTGHTEVATCSMESLELGTGSIADLSAQTLNIYSSADFYIETTFTIHGVSGEVDVLNVYEWVPDTSQNLYYDKGNIIVGSPNVSLDASLNVSGNVYISEDLDVQGVVTAQSVTQTSDARLKTNIRDLSNGLDMIRQIQPKLYNKKNSYLKEVGVLAQDILNIEGLEHLVRMDEKTQMYTMNYMGLYMYAIQAIQELEAKLLRACP